MNSEKLAKAISILFSPLLVGIIFVFSLFIGTMGLSLKTILWSSLYISLTSLMPLLILWYLVKTGRVGDKDITVKEERRIFFRVILPFYLMAFVLLFLTRAPRPIFLTGSGAIIVVLVYYLISPAYKISAHLGGLAFVTVTLSLVVSRNFYLSSPLLLLLTWARRKLKKHTLAQSFWGASAGGGIPMLIFKLFA